MARRIQAGDSPKIKTLADKALSAAKLQVGKVLEANWPEVWKLMEQAHTRAIARGGKVKTFKVGLAVDIEAKGPVDYLILAHVAAGHRITDSTTGQSVGDHPDLFDQ